MKSPDFNDITALTATQTLRRRMLTLSRHKKQAAMVLADLVSFVAIGLAAQWLVGANGSSTADALLLGIVAALIATPVAWFIGLYRSIIRFMGGDLFSAGLKTASLSAILFSIFAILIGSVVDPVRIGTAFAILVLIYLVGGRLAARMFLNRRNANREPVIIYGAGEGGARLVGSLFGGDDYLPVALVDDNPALVGKRIHGLEVFDPSSIEGLIETTAASGVLLAVPSASRRHRRKILDRLAKYPVHVRTVPEIRDLVSGKARVDDLSDVHVKDILGRDTVPPVEDLLRGSIAGKCVMVTGAGGSIGSELCRQIVQLNPKRLVCYEISESALYFIDRELKKLLAGGDNICEVIPLLGSAHDEKRVLEALQAFDIQTVYHAAAYKHVPIVEHNLFEGIQNNVFGTLHAARAAMRANVETFVLISTDKAVNPTSVMGATKRLAEQVLQAYNSRAENTQFCMVRFGNVLESSGSVVPLFREQIRNGGPVTVTHREIIRYFMTIPEAAQLVIQAASMAKGGDVFVLDMGEPVRIEDLAHRMISLMGLTVRSAENPEGDIEVQYIGLRPAEKLYEELLIGSNVSGTGHPRIMRADEDYLSYSDLDELLSNLGSALATLDYDQARDILRTAVKEYAPSNGIDDLVWLQKTGTDDESRKVVDFPLPKS
ncbi:MAG: polysaccharide biosynthesis protein [Woeseiaceae bacterium]